MPKRYPKTTYSFTRYIFVFLLYFLSISIALQSPRASRFLTPKNYRLDIVQWHLIQLINFEYLTYQGQAEMLLFLPDLPAVNGVLNLFLLSPFDNISSLYPPKNFLMLNSNNRKCQDLQDNHELTSSTYKSVAYSSAWNDIYTLKNMVHINRICNMYMSLLEIWFDWFNSVHIFNIQTRVIFGLWIHLFKIIKFCD